jgi:integrase/recombinase XerD
MGIYRRGKTYWARAQREGREHRRSLKTTSKAVAERRYRQWHDDLDAIAWGDKPRRRFDDAADRFVKEHLPNLKPSSARRYGVSLDWLADEFEGKLLDQIGTAALMEFERKRRAQASVPTVRRDLACLSSIFGCCIEWEWCDANPVPAYMRRRKKRGLREAPPRTRYLSHGEETQLLEKTSPAVRLAVMFAIDTGLRRDEQFGLTWDQIDLQANAILLDGSTKSGRPRRVPSSRGPQMPRHIRSPYVFHHRNGNRLVNMEKGLKAARRRAGIRALRWHDLRRTCGCRLLQDHGLSMEAVKEWLGHESVVTTERAYAFLEFEHLHLAAQKTAQA